MVLSLRPATSEDAAFSFQVYASTRADEMSVVPWSEEEKRSFLEMQFNAQRASYLQNRPQAEWLVVMRDELAIGRMIVDRSADEICLMDIALLPEHRNAGVGSKFIKELMAEAEAVLVGAQGADQVLAGIGGKAARCLVVASMDVAPFDRQSRAFCATSAGCVTGSPRQTPWPCKAPDAAFR